MVIRRRDVDAETQIYIDFEANKKQLRSSTDTNLEQLRAKMMQLRCMVDGRTSTIVPEFSRTRQCYFHVGRLLGFGSH